MTSMLKTDILIIHGTDYENMAYRLCERAGLAELIGSRTARVALKPNILGTIRPETGATTHPELVCGVLSYLKENAFENVCIMEGAWVGDNTHRAFRALGYDRISREYDVPLVDLQQDKSVTLDAKGMKISVCRKALEADFVINLPVVKGHCQTVITCALKNNKGVIPNREKRRFHTLGLDRPIAHLNTVVRNDFILADNICGDLDFEEGGNPVQMDRALAFRDPVLCDAFVCDTLGIPPEEVIYLGLAERLGVGSTDLRKAHIIRLNEASDAGAADAGSPAAAQQHGYRVKKLAAFVRPQSACSACYGQLIYALNQLDEDGLLTAGNEKIAIGQGYRGASGRIGIGACTAGFDCSLRGCPPKAIDIRNFLEENWR